MNTFKQRWNAIPRPGRIVIYVILGVIGVTLMGFVFGLGIRGLWNWLMPNIFGLKEITFWQAIGIFILAKILFGGFGGGDSSDKSKKEEEKPLSAGGETSIKQGWQHYDEWWDAEGKQAFHQYVEGQVSEKGNPGE